MESYFRLLNQKYEKWLTYIPKKILPSGNCYSEFATNYLNGETKVKREVQSRSRCSKIYLLLVIKTGLTYFWPSIYRSITWSKFTWPGHIHIWVKWLIYKYNTHMQKHDNAKFKHQPQKLRVHIRRRFKNGPTNVIQNSNVRLISIVPLESLWPTLSLLDVHIGM